MLNKAKQHNQKNDQNVSVEQIMTLNSLGRSKKQGFYVNVDKWIGWLQKITKKKLNPHLTPEALDLVTVKSE